MAGQPGMRRAARALSAVALALMALPSLPASAAGLGLSGRLSVHTGGFNSNSTVLSYNLATGDPLGSFTPVPNPANGRGLAFDLDGNVLTTALNPGTGDFGGDGRIHKFSRAGAELGSICVGGPKLPLETDCSQRPKLGALDFDVEENVIWGAVYRPDSGSDRLLKIDPADGTIRDECSLPFDEAAAGAGNDSLAVGKIGGVKMLLTDDADGISTATTVFAIRASACTLGAQIALPGPDATAYRLKANGADVARVTGVSWDRGTGDLLVASLAPDFATTNILNLGTAPFQTQIGGPLLVSALVFDIAIDTSLLDDFNRADGGRYTSNLGPSWAGSSVDGGFYRISSNQLKNQNGAYIFWNAASFGANQEAGVTFNQLSTVASEQDLILKAQNLSPTGGSGSGASLIEISYDATQAKILVNTAVPNGQYPRPQWVTHLTLAQTLANGDKLSGQALDDGTVKIYRNGSLIGQTNVTQGTNPFPAALAAGGGKVGLWVIGATSANPSLMDNFRGGTIVR